MPTAAELQIILKAKDEASKVMKDATKNTEGLGEAFKKLAVGAAAVVGVMAGIGGAMIKLATDALPLQGISDSFAGISGNADEALAKLREGALGMASDAELMRSYNQAAQLVSKTFADQLPEAMGYLSKVSAATGQDMGYMINSLVKGVGRMSPMILDNLGIQVSLAEATDRAAQMFGKQADQLSKTEQQAGMMSVVMEKLKANTAAMPEVAGTATQSWSAFKVELQNLKDQIGVSVIPAFQALITPVMQLAREYGPQLATFVKDSLVPAVIKGAEVFAQFANFIISDVVPAVVQMATFVRDNLVIILAGLAALIVKIVVPALLLWAKAAITAAAGTIAALAPILIPILAIMTAVALLRAAWERDFLGMRTAVQAAWNDSGTLLGKLALALGLVKEATMDVTEKNALMSQSFNDVGVKVREITRYQSDFNDVGVKTVSVIDNTGRAVDAYASRLQGLGEMAARQTEAMKGAFEGLQNGIVDTVTRAYQVQADTQQKLTDLERTHTEKRAELVRAGKTDELAVLDWKHEQETLKIKLQQATELQDLRDTFTAKAIITMNETMHLHSQELTELANHFNLKGNAQMKAFIFERTLAEAQMNIVKQLGETDKEYTQRVIEYAIKQAQAVLGAANAVQQLQAAWNSLASQAPIQIAMPAMPAMPDMPSASTGGGGGGGYTPTPVSPVQAIEDTVKKAADAIHAAIEALDALVKWGGVKLATVKANAANMAKAMNLVIVELIHAAWEFGDAERDWRDIPKAAAEFAGYAGQVMGQMKSVVDGLDAIASYKRGAIGRVHAVMADLKIVLSAITMTFADVGNWLANMPALFDRIAGTIGHMKTIVDALDAVSGYKRGAIGHVHAVVQDLRVMMSSIAVHFGQIGEYWLKNMPPLFERIVATIGGMKTIVDALDAVAGYKRGAIGHVHAVTEDLLIMMSSIATRFQVVGEYWLKNMPALYGRIVETIGGMKTIVDALVAVSSYKRGAIGHVHAVVDDLLIVLSAIATRFGKIGAGWLSTLPPLFERAVSVLSGMKTLVDGLVAVSEYKRGAIGHVHAFVDDLIIALSAIAMKFGGIGEYWLSGIVKWWDRAAQVLNPVKNFVDALTAIASYGGAKLANIQRFVDDLKTTLIAVANAFRDFGEYWLVNVAKIFERGGTIFESMNSALGMFKSLEEFTGGKYISPAKIDTLISMMKYVMEAFVWLGYYVGPIIKEATRLFAEDSKAMFDSMNAALDFFVKLADNALPTRDKVAEFVRLMQQIAQDMYRAAAASADAVRNFGVASANMGQIPGGRVSVLGGMTMGGGSVPYSTAVQPIYPTAPGGGWPGFDAPPKYSGGGGGGGGGGGSSEKTEFYLHNIANDIHDLLYIEKVKAEREGNAGLLAEINQLLGAEAFIWTRT